MAIEAVLFDLDGVLIDSGEAHHESWKQLARQHDLVIDKATFARTFGRRNREIIPSIWNRPLSIEEIDSLSEQKESLYRDLVRGSLEPLPGAAELVRDCHSAGLKLAVGSSTHPKNLDLALEELDLARYFSATVTAVDVDKGKPAPDVFLRAAERLGVSPENAVVIEDAPSGIAAARSAGCFAVGVTSQHSAYALQEAHRIVDSLSQLNAKSLMQFSTAS